MAPVAPVLRWRPRRRQRPLHHSPVAPVPVVPPQPPQAPNTPAADFQDGANNQISAAESELEAKKRRSQRLLRTERRTQKDKRVRQRRSARRRLMLQARKAEMQAVRATRMPNTNDTAQPNKFALPAPTVFSSRPGRRRIWRSFRRRHHRIAKPRSIRRVPAGSRSSRARQAFRQGFDRATDNGVRPDLFRASAGLPGDHRSRDHRGRPTGREAGRPPPGQGIQPQSDAAANHPPETGRSDLMGPNEILRHRGGDPGGDGRRHVAGLLRRLGRPVADHPRVFRSTKCTSPCGL